MIWLFLIILSLLNHENYFLENLEINDHRENSANLEKDSPIAKINSAKLNFLDLSVTKIYSAKICTLKVCTSLTRPTCPERVESKK